MLLHGLVLSQQIPKSLFHRCKILVLQNERIQFWEWKIMETGEKLGIFLGLNWVSLAKLISQASILRLGWVMWERAGYAMMEERRDDRWHGHYVCGVSNVSMEQPSLSQVSGQDSFPTFLARNVVWQVCGHRQPHTHTFQGGNIFRCLPKLIRQRPGSWNETSIE